MNSFEVSSFAASPQAPEAHLEIRDLSVAYAGQIAVRNLTLPCYRGHITSVVGPSGCGKSSFLNSLNRLTDLIPHCAVTGSVVCDGLDIRHANWNVAKWRRRVGMIFQKPNPFPLSIRENLALALREHGHKEKAEQDHIIEMALRKVGLWAEVKDGLHKSALSLSGGQQQRLCMARAIALEPEMILLDEPCSALDPIASNTIEQLIMSWRGRLTVVIVTHNLAQARRISDYTAFLWYKGGAGELIEFGPTRQIFAEPRDPLTQAYVNGVTG